MHFLTDSLAILLAALFGLAFGSFVTMASYRIPREEGIAVKRSRCPLCEQPLGIKDLFPFFSWFFSKGRCRYCKGLISLRYPAIEIGTALTFALVALRLGITPEAGLLMLLAVALAIMIVIDFEHGWIPDTVQLAVLALGILYRVMHGDWQEGLISAGACALIAGALYFGYKLVKKREGLGLGDVKFFCASGIWLSPYLLPSYLFIAGVLGIATALFWQYGLKKGREFPFGPALAVSLFLCLIFPEMEGLFRR